MRLEVRDILRRLVDAKDGAGLVEGSVSCDHACMCLRIAPKNRVAKVMRCLKGNPCSICIK